MSFYINYIIIMLKFQHEFRFHILNILKKNLTGQRGDLTSPHPQYGPRKRKFGGFTESRELGDNRAADQP